MTPLSAAIVALGISAALAGNSLAGTASGEAPRCHAGAYRNDRGDVLALGTTPTKGTLRYYLMDGRSGLLRPLSAGEYVAGPAWEETSPTVARADLGTCAATRIKFALADGPRGDWTKVPLVLGDTRFASKGVMLAGRLVEPPGTGPSPAVVLVHGSADTASLDSEPWQWLFPANGVSVFVFDKRGTGASEGVYTQDFVALADDVAAAVAQARKIGHGRISRLGLQGLSQGGWVAPLAATRAPVDFIEIGYGVVGTPIEQDQWQVDYELTQHGFGPQTLLEAHALTEEAGKIASGNFEGDLSNLRALQARYQGEPWITRFEGQYTGELLRGEVARARKESPEVIWHYDSLAPLRKLSIPQLWTMAGADSLAPSAPTISRLQQLQAQGLPIKIAVFPDTDHGIYNFVVGPDGSRKRTRYAAGYFALQLDWIKGHLQPPYGRARFLDSTPERGLRH
jgi:dienelactone hydrolase